MGRKDYDFDSYVTIVAFHLVLTADQVDFKSVSWNGHDSLYATFVKDDKQFYSWHTVSKGKLYRFVCAGNNSSPTVKQECTNLAKSIKIHSL